MSAPESALDATLAPVEVAAPAAPAAELAASAAPAAAAAAPPAAPAAPPARLLTRGFLLLWQGQAVSQLGNQAFAFAMIYWLLERTGSASLMGLLMTLGALPGVLLGPFGGTLADRFPRVRILVVCDALAAVLILLMSLAFAVPLSTALLVGCLAVCAVSLAVIRAFFMPAIASAIPDLVAGERLAAANSLNQLVIQVSALLGQGIGGVLYRLLGAPVMLLFDGLTFVYAAASSALIGSADGARPRPARPAAGGMRGVLRAFLAETREGLRYTWGRPGLRDFLLVASLINFLMMPVMVLMPFYVQLYLRRGAEWYGFLLAALSAGTVAGFTLAGALRLRGAARGRALLAGLFLGPPSLAIMGLVQQPVAALALCFLAGLATGLVNISLITMLQSSTPTELRGRVMGLLVTLATGLMPIGTAVGGILGDLTGKNVPLVFGGCAVLAIVALLGTATRRSCRAFLAQEA
jgi:DHA3 family macrolide efflux protein-like MFS transporter